MSKQSRHVKRFKRKLKQRERRLVRAQRQKKRYHAHIKKAASSE